MKKRVPEFKVAEFIINRWSPRAMSGESISNDELMSLFEASKWAPSSYNNQPWRFIYAKRETPEWNAFLDLLVPFNQSWAKNGSVLIIIVSRNVFEYNGKPSRTHSFDAGAAWENLALQGSMNGLVVHGMEGFDYEKAAKLISLPDDYVVEAMCAVGKPGKLKNLPKELQDKEVISGRKFVRDIAFEGKFSSLK